LVARRPLHRVQFGSWRKIRHLGAADARHGRAGDYVEINLEFEYRYNPLHNDFDAYALAYNIASLLNNLYGRGKKPFWQQAYTNS
jgi:hypothetical protein